MIKINLLRKTIIVSFILLAVCGLSKWWHVYTGGFKTNKILPPKEYDLKFSYYPKKLSKDFYTVFDQPYYYLDKGCQVYVFESADKKHVIKFIRHHKYKPHFWMKFSKLSKYIERRKQYRLFSNRKWMKNNLYSYVMSIEDLKDITEVEYVHLCKTNHINKRLLIFDKLGQKRFINLDNMHFIVQKKALNLKPLLLSSYRQKDYEKTKELIDEYFFLLKKRILRKICNVDKSGFLRNVAYMDGKMIEIDVGGFRKNEELFLDINLEKELNRFAFSFQKWSKKKIPLLHDYISNKAEITKDAIYKQINK